MRVTITKEERFDRIAIVRADGSQAETLFPKKGPVPHDAVHFFVERTLRPKNAFWGMVASGLHPEQVQEIAKAGGHASAKRAGEPSSEIVELLQAERLVECFEAQLWGGKSAPADFRAVAETACEASLVRLPPLSDAAIASISAKVSALHVEWVAAPIGHQLTLDWAG